MLIAMKFRFSEKKYFVLLVVILLSMNISAQNNSAKPKVTFVELGSVNCIPCKQMQPVMRSIEEKYGAQVKVIFYDVWKDDQKKYAKQYGIKLIPTQVFLDENGKEFHRHEGFYPEAEIDKILQGKGLKEKTKK
ncbi:MAG: thioredoxin family protein [Ignavibacteria bacterium]|nr:thioredoxin family protein [Ignavibacteria bacterium]